MVYTLSAIAVFIFFMIWFLICIQQKNYGLVDIAWGLGMATLAIILMITFKPDIQITISLSLIVLWGTRLGVYLGKRNWGKPEDYRYVQLRKRWGTKFPLIKAFLNVFVLQGVLLYLMMFSSMNAIANASAVNGITLIMGVGVALFGLGFEIVGDYQLAQFKKHAENKGKLMTGGFWSLTRHPNYFGEVVFWWGIFIASYQNMYSLFGILSPLLITVLINYVSGVPLLERKYATNVEYIAYAKRTPRMIPLLGSKEIKK